MSDQRSEHVRSVIHPSGKSFDSWRTTDVVLIAMQRNPRGGERGSRKELETVTLGLRLPLEAIPFAQGFFDRKLGTEAKRNGALEQIWWRLGYRCIRERGPCRNSDQHRRDVSGKTVRLLDKLAESVKVATRVGAGFFSSIECLQVIGKVITNDQGVRRRKGAGAGQSGLIPPLIS